MYYGLLRLVARQFPGGSGSIRPDYRSCTLFLRNIDRKAFEQISPVLCIERHPCHTCKSITKIRRPSWPSPGRFRLLQTRQKLPPLTLTNLSIATSVCLKRTKHVVKSRTSGIFSVFHPVPEQPEQLLSSFDLRQTVCRLQRSLRSPAEEERRSNILLAPVHDLSHLIPVIQFPSNSIFQRAPPPMIIPSNF